MPRRNELRVTWLCLVCNSKRIWRTEIAKETEQQTGTYNDSLIEETNGKKYYEITWLVYRCLECFATKKK